MTASRDDLIRTFERAAQDARQAEDAYRKKAAKRIDELARERATAFRRMNLISAISAAVSRENDPDGARAAARAATCRALEWEEETERQGEILDRLGPVFASLSEEATEGEAEHPALIHLREFETWYRSWAGSDFYDLFDRYVPETPRVDF